MWRLLDPDPLVPSPQTTAYLAGEVYCELCCTEPTSQQFVCLLKSATSILKGLRCQTRAVVLRVWLACSGRAELMLCLAILRAIEAGAGEMMLVTHPYNHAAIRLFHKFGFEAHPNCESHNPSFSHVMKLRLGPKHSRSVRLNLEHLLYVHIERHGQAARVTRSRR